MQRLQTWTKMESELRQALQRQTVTEKANAYRWNERFVARWQHTRSERSHHIAARSAQSLATKTMFPY